MFDGTDSSPSVVAVWTVAGVCGRMRDSSPPSTVTCERLTAGAAADSPPRAEGAKLRPALSPVIEPVIVSDTVAAVNALSLSLAIMERGSRNARLLSPGGCNRGSGPAELSGEAHCHWRVLGTSESGLVTTTK